MFKVIINNKNRLSTTKKLVYDLLERNTKEIWILDNQSTYEPLLEWYDTVPNEVKVHRLVNYGHMALFSSGVLNAIKEDWCIYTDSDIQVNTNMPKEYQSIMLEYALKYDINKIGLALDISDLPNHYMFKAQVLRNEHRWWLEEIETNAYLADTDTTFALNKKCDQFKSIRLAGDFTAKHIPWYLDLENISEEERYYMDNVDSRALTQYTKQHILKKEL
jgi:hypothetical protein